MITRLSTGNAVATRNDILSNFSFYKEPILERGVEQDEKETAIRRRKAKVISVPSFKDLPVQVATRFNCLQEWEGCVQHVSSDTFTATLYDKTDKRGIEDEEADFPIEDLSEDDKQLLKPGAVFRWLIGYRSIGGTKERTSSLVFRRLPQWTDSDLKEAEEKAAYYAENTKWE